MKVLILIPVLSCLLLTDCKSQTNEQNKTQEIVDKAKKETESEEERIRFKKIAESNNLKANLTKQINSLNDSVKIDSKRKIIEISDKLKTALIESEELLKKKHGIDNSGELKNKMDVIYVNQIFIVENKAEEIRSLIHNSVNQYLSISSKQELGVKKENLPITIILSMDKGGKSWENRIFKDMPASLLLSLMQTMKNEIILTELYMLEKLAYN